MKSLTPLLAISFLIGCDGEKSTVAPSKDSPEEDAALNKEVNLGKSEKPIMPIDLALKLGALEVIKQHLIAGTDVNSRNHHGETPLMISAAEGNRKVVELLISKGANVNSRDHYGEIPLNRALSIEMAELLVEKGADVNSRDDDGLTPLHRAFSTDIAKLLIEQGADVNSRDHNGVTPLNGAISIDMAKLLVEKGADVNSRDDDGATPLHGACQFFEGEELIKLLISKGANVNTKTNDGLTPLYCAASVSWDAKNIVKLLIANGATVKSVDKRAPTPLHCAAYRGHSKLAELLIEKGANVNSRDHTGATPLDYSILGEHKEFAELLRRNGGESGIEDSIFAATIHGNVEAVKKHLDSGIDVNIKDEDGINLLSYAAMEGKMEITEFLIKAGANVNASSKAKDTALDYALDYETVKLLTTNGADVNIKGEGNGRTRLFIAVEHGDLKVGNLLIDAGADVNSIDFEGNSVLDFAFSFFNKTEFVNLLREHGAKTAEELEASPIFGGQKKTFKDIITCD